MIVNLEKAKTEFLKYTENYDLTNENIRRKQGHSIRVMNISKQIAVELNLSDDQIQIAALIGLLHDIARFEQYTQYQTYNDNRSFDHGDYGVEILNKDMRKYIKTDKYDKLIKIAIKNHNKFEIEEGLNEEESLFAKIIRDADKIDILYEAVSMFWNGEEKDINNTEISSKVMEKIEERELIKRDKNKMEMLLRSLARNESSISSNSVLVKDICESSDENELMISRNTVSDYLNVLNRLHLIENQDSFMYKIRSRSNVGKNPKRHFTDPSLGCAALNITPEKLMNDLNTFGLYFEALCERDLRIYAQNIGAKLYHYRDNVSGLEVDSIIELSDGEYGAIEIKLGSNMEEEAADNLKKFYNLAEVKPKFMCIICGLYNAVVKRKDGIYVLPITALKP